MTKEEVENSFEFKVVKRVLIQEHPWIKDMEIDGDPNEYRLSLFINLYIDPYELAELTDTEVKRWVKSSLISHGVFDCGFLSIIIDHTVTADSITDEIKNTIKSIHNSKILDESLKLEKLLNLIGFKIRMEDLSDESKMKLQETN